MISCVSSITDRRRRQNMVWTSLTHPAAWARYFFVLVLHWRPLWSIPEQTPSNMANFQTAHTCIMREWKEHVMNKASYLLILYCWPTVSTVAG